MTTEHPLARLWLRLAHGEAVVGGVLSGTSADGIDVVLMRFGVAGRPRTLAFHSAPFALPLAQELRAVLDGKPLGARDVAVLTRSLGRAFGCAARALAEREGLELDLLGSHGQTVLHHDGNDPAGALTLQLGDGDFVAQAARAPVVSDFRMADIASGGEGAPLSGVLERELFPDLDLPAAVLNLGGMANVTYLAPGRAPLAFDCGPANALLDGCARVLLGRDFDDGGASAASGRVSGVLLEELLRHPFFTRRPPKSTGRDTFGAAWVGGVLARARELGLGAPEVLATGVALVAESVAMALRDFLPARPLRLVLCGGGVRNLALVRSLAQRTSLPTCSSAEVGVDPEAREAVLFAHLAVRWALARPSSEPGVTGACPGAILGKLSLPPQAPRSGDSGPVPRSRGAIPG